jgi:hypothetical protein
MDTGWRLATAAAVAAALAACGTSGHPGNSDSGAASQDAGVVDAADDVEDAPVATSDAPTGPYPGDEPPEFGPDGCALNAIACTTDTQCCSGLCNQGECGSPNHPADRPGR